MAKTQKKPESRQARYRRKYGWRMFFFSGKAIVVAGGLLAMLSVAIWFFFTLPNAPPALCVLTVGESNSGRVDADWMGTHWSPLVADPSLTPVIRINSADGSTANLRLNSKSKLQFAGPDGNLLIVYWSPLVAAKTESGVSTPVVYLPFDDRNHSNAQQEFQSYHRVPSTEDSKNAVSKDPPNANAWRNFFDVLDAVVDLGNDADRNLLKVIRRADKKTILLVCDLQTLEFPTSNQSFQFQSDFCLAVQSGWADWMARSGTNDVNIAVCLSNGSFQRNEFDLPDADRASSLATIFRSQFEAVYAGLDKSANGTDDVLSWNDFKTQMRAGVVQRAHVLKTAQEPVFLAAPNLEFDIRKIGANETKVDFLKPRQRDSGQSIDALWQKLADRKGDLLLRNPARYQEALVCLLRLEQLWMAGLTTENGGKTRFNEFDKLTNHVEGLCARDEPSPTITLHEAATQFSRNSNPSLNFDTAATSIFTGQRLIEFFDLLTGKSKVNSEGDSGTDAVPPARSTEKSGGNVTTTPAAGVEPAPIVENKPSAPTKPDPDAAKALWDAEFAAVRVEPAVQVFLFWKRLCAEPDGRLLTQDRLKKLIEFLAGNDWAFADSPTRLYWSEIAHMKRLADDLIWKGYEEYPGTVLLSLQVRDIANQFAAQVCPVLLNESLESQPAADSKSRFQARFADLEQRRRLVEDQIFANSYENTNGELRPLISEYNSLLADYEKFRSAVYDANEKAVLAPHFQRYVIESVCNRLLGLPDELAATGSDDSTKEKTPAAPPAATPAPSPDSSERWLKLLAPEQAWAKFDRMPPGSGYDFLAARSTDLSAKESAIAAGFDEPFHRGWASTPTKDREKLRSKKDDIEAFRLSLRLLLYPAALDDLKTSEIRSIIVNAKSTTRQPLDRNLKLDNAKQEQTIKSLATVLADSVSTIRPPNSEKPAVDRTALQVVCDSAQQSHIAWNGFAKPPSTAMPQTSLSATSVDCSSDCDREWIAASERYHELRLRRVLLDFWANKFDRGGYYFAEAATRILKSWPGETGIERHGPLLDPYVHFADGFSFGKDRQLQAADGASKNSINPKLEYLGQPLDFPGESVARLSMSAKSRSAVKGWAFQREPVEPGQLDLNEYAADVDVYFRGLRTPSIAVKWFKAHVPILSTASMSFTPQPLPPQIVIRNTNPIINDIVFVLDCSSSMNEEVKLGDGSTPSRLTMLKRSLTAFINRAAQERNCRVQFVVFGCEYKPDDNSFLPPVSNSWGKLPEYIPQSIDTELLAPEQVYRFPKSLIESEPLLTTENQAAFEDAIKGIELKSQAYTPLFFSIGLARKLFRGEPKLLVVVSDGIDFPRIHPSIESLPDDLPAERRQKNDLITRYNQLTSLQMLPDRPENSGHESASKWLKSELEKLDLDVRYFNFEKSVEPSKTEIESIAKQVKSAAQLEEETNNLRARKQLRSDIMTSLTNSTSYLEDSGNLEQFFADIAPETRGRVDLKNSESDLIEETLRFVSGKIDSPKQVAFGQVPVRSDYSIRLTQKRSGDSNQEGLRFPLDGTFFPQFRGGELLEFDFDEQQHALSLRNFSPSEARFVQADNCRQFADGTWSKLDTTGDSMEFLFWSGNELVPTGRPDFAVVELQAPDRAGRLILQDNDWDTSTLKNVVRSRFPRIPAEFSRDKPWIKKDGLILTLTKLRFSPDGAMPSSWKKLAVPSNKMSLGELLVGKPNELVPWVVSVDKDSEPSGEIAVTVRLFIDNPPVDPVDRDVSVERRVEGLVVQLADKNDQSLTANRVKRVSEFEDGRLIRVTHTFTFSRAADFSVRIIELDAAKSDPESESIDFNNVKQQHVISKIP